ncbi:hypothetical protein ACMEZ0_03040, partial [Bifidobacterium adolescentis]
LANENRTQDAGHALLRQGRNPKVRKNSGVIQPHTVTTRESCTSNGVEAVSLPAKNFLGATSLSIINIGNTDLVVSVYEVKESHRE